DLLPFSPPSIGKNRLRSAPFHITDRCLCVWCLDVTPAAEMKCLRARRPLVFPTFRIRSPEAVAARSGMSRSRLSRPTTTARHPRIGQLRPQYDQEMLLPVQPIPSVRAVRPGAHLPCRSGVFERRARSSTEQEIRGDLSGLAEPISASVETGALDNQCLQGGRVDGVTLVEIDGTHRLAVQTRVEETLRILQLGALWKRQPHGVLEGLAYADDAVVGPDGDSLGA